MLYLITGDLDPQWLSDNEPLQQFLIEMEGRHGGASTNTASADTKAGGSSVTTSGLEQKAQRKLRKLTNQVARRSTHLADPRDPRAFQSVALHSSR